MIDSSMFAVPGISTANSHADASSSSSGSPVSTTWPVSPSPTRVRKTWAAVRSVAVSSPWNAIGSSSSPSRMKTRQLW